jgi:hypothetical protein
MYCQQSTLPNLEKHNFPSWVNKVLSMWLSSTLNLCRLQYRQHSRVDLWRETQMLATLQFQWMSFVHELHTNGPRPGGVWSVQGEGLGICVAFTAILLSLMSGCSVDQWLAVSLSPPLNLVLLEPGTLLRYLVFCYTTRHMCSLQWGKHTKGWAWQGYSAMESSSLCS